MSVTELKERHSAATETVNNLRHRLKQKRLSLLDTDISAYAKSQGRTPVSFGPTDLVCCRTLQGHTGKVYSLDWTCEKSQIVSASQDGRLIVWNALTRQKIHAIKLPCAWVMTCAFSPTGQSVACGGLDSVCSIFSLNSPTDKDGNLPVSRMLSGHKGYVSSSSDRYPNISDSEYIMGFVWDVLGSALHGLIFALSELVFVKLLGRRSFIVVLEQQVMVSLFAFIFTTVGMLVSGDFQGMAHEATTFKGGRTAYYLVIIWGAITFQLGVLGMISLEEDKQMKPVIKDHLHGHAKQIR